MPVTRPDSKPKTPTALSKWNHSQIAAPCGSGPRPLSCRFRLLRERIQT